MEEILIILIAVNIILNIYQFKTNKKLNNKIKNKTIGQLEYKIKIDTEEYQKILKKLEEDLIKGQNTGNKKPIGLFKNEER